MKKLAALLLSLVLVFTLLAACRDNSGGWQSSEPAKSTELYIQAAASLTDVITELSKAYMDENGHVTIITNFGSSGTLQTQIEEGVPADVFLSAAQKQMNALEEKGLIDVSTRLDLLVNKVVLIVPADSDIDLASFEDVTTDKVSMMAIGDETVPVGQYTEEIYTYLGAWDEVKAKANLGTDVRSVLTWVESGDVDCGIVYATDAASSELVKVVAEAPEGSHQPVVYPGAVLSGSENPNEAKAFLDYLSTDAAVRAFEAAGFTMAD